MAKNSRIALTTGNDLESPVVSAGDGVVVLYSHRMMRIETAHARAFVVIIISIVQLLLGQPPSGSSATCP